jgi:CRP-like cAMP-binding protein
VSQNPLQNFTVRFRQGDPVFVEGEKGRTMYIVQSGLVRLFQQIHGNRQDLGTLEKGDFFGEMSILEGLPRTVSAVAAEDSELIEINHAVFDKMIRSNIEIAVRMLRKLSIRLRESESRVASLQAGKPEAATRSAAVRRVVHRTPAQAITGPRLELEDQDVAYSLADGDTLIGRYDPVTQLMPDIDLTDLDLKRSVSRQHARIMRMGEKFSVVEEVGALNGTFINDTRLTTGQHHPLSDGDRLGFGSVSILFRI